MIKKIISVVFFLGLFSISVFCINKNYLFLKYDLLHHSKFLTLKITGNNINQDQHIPQQKISKLEISLFDSNRCIYSYSDSCDGIMATINFTNYSVEQLNIDNRHCITLVYQVVSYNGPDFIESKYCMFFGDSLIIIPITYNYDEDSLKYVLSISEEEFYNQIPAFYKEAVIQNNVYDGFK